MKKSINQWSFPNMNIIECIRLADEAGYDCFEPVFAEDGPLSPSSSRKDVELVRKTIEVSGLTVASLACGIHWSFNPASHHESTRVKSQELTKRAIERAAWLGTDTLLVIPGTVAPGFGTPSEVIPYNVCYERALDFMRQLAPVAEKHKVTLAVENVWNSFLLSPLEMRDFVDAVGSEYAGVYLDVGNVIPFGFPEHWIHILGSRIRRIHMKDFRRSVGTIHGFVDLLSGDVNWPEVMKALVHIGYSGPLTAEMSSYKKDPKGIIHQTSRALDRIIGMSSKYTLRKAPPGPSPN